MESTHADERDPMGPPADPCECFCLHCRRIFMSDGMWFQKVINSKDGFPGFWMCPTANCSGTGFTMDIFPTDPNHPANDGWHSSDDEGDEEEASGEEDEWDPAESKFEELDEEFGDDDDDIEGDEWKHGVRPDELPIVPPEMTDEQRESQAQAQREQEEEERRYNMPDERPRVLDWSNREDPPPMDIDSIPF